MAKREWEDAEMLDILDRFANGQSATVIGNRYSMSRSAMLGIRHRCGSHAEVDRDAHAGTMPAGWWKEGLKSRSVSA